ncbi:site-specific integrase [Curtobacterium pusillum]|uniref:tyrosine-type recombinase/integrase n=1 Tax=Curtobacterium pusillum TaxID=69373 RepID=UPI0011A6CFC3|nr:site-specific integrase [Curtobacterium pusillum]
MTKRGNGEGSVSRRLDGKWEARFSYVDASTGRQKRVSSYGATRAEAVRKSKEKRARVEAGQPARDSTLTVGEYARQWCGSTLAVSPRKESTRATYTTLLEAYVIDSPLGALSFERAKPTDVERWLAALVRRDGEAVSDSTRRQAYTVLRAVFDTAVRDGLAARNIVATVARPRVKSSEERFLTPDETTRLLEAARRATPRYAPILEILVRTGLRRGEALALCWPDVDLDSGTVRVRGTLGRVGGVLAVTEPKTDRSRRTISIGPRAVALLREVQAAQASEHRAHADLWAGGSFVFTTPTGTPLDPRNVLRAVGEAAKRAGLDGVKVHTLRHTAASIMLGKGESLKAVSDHLGHSSVAITGDVYGALAPDVKREAALALDGAF